MATRKLGGMLGRELARSGIAVIAVAAVVLIYQGCSQPADTASESSPPGAVNAQEAAAVEEVEIEIEIEEPMVMAQETEADPHAGHEMATEGSDTKDLPTKAIAVVAPTEGNECNGTVTFTKVDGGTKVEAHIMGLTPGKHGFHIHEFGDISAADGTSTGGHFNPMGVDHAGPSSPSRHVGDMGNLEANDEGHAMHSATLEGMDIHFILGRGITIHAGEDDLTSQPTGNAGGRVGVAVIGVAKAE